MGCWHIRINCNSFFRIEYTLKILLSGRPISGHLHAHIQSHLVKLSILLCKHLHHLTHLHGCFCAVTVVLFQFRCVGTRLSTI